VDRKVAQGFRFEAGPVTWPALVVHGGAGTYAWIVDASPGKVTEVEDAIAAALDAGWNHAEDPVEAVVAAVACMEVHGGFNAGRGSVPNTDGRVEMDAAVMDGSGRAGAVACMQAHSPILAARTLLLGGEAVLLAGAGADRFAGEAGVPGLVPASAGEHLRQDGTVGAVAVSSDGRFAAAGSTGGRSGQPPGRVGDTPIPGAGLWAGPTCAVSATGMGEAFIMAGFSRMVASAHSSGRVLSESFSAGLDAVAGYGGTGGGIALGADRSWAAAYSTRAMSRGVRDRGGRRVAVID
jgi:isoaspartyl peptidase/L-asparaginase-like protein (Ntn-hydrolase superfamily)